MKDNKTIGLTVRFWTNDLPDKIGEKYTPVWNSGSIVVEANKNLGIKASSKVFNNIAEIETVIKQLLTKNKIAIIVPK